MLCHAYIYCAVVVFGAHDVDAMNDWYVVLLRDVFACLAVVLLEIEITAWEYADHVCRVLVEECLHRLRRESSTRLVIRRSKKYIGRCAVIVCQLHRVGG